MQDKNYSYQEVMNAIYDLTQSGKQMEKSIKELRESGKDTDKFLKENLFETRRLISENEEKTRKIIAENEEKTLKIMAENDVKYNQKMDKMNRLLTKKINKLSKQVGGIANNLGTIAEDLFFHSFSKSMAIGQMDFHTIDRNVYRRSSGIEDEFDIVLTNDNVILICEVKQKYHPDDVDNVLKKNKNYNILFPMQTNYKVYGAVAGLTIPQETVQRAKERNLFVVTQDGNAIRFLNAPEQI